jgi:hypothetical protein
VEERDENTGRGGVGRAANVAFIREKIEDREKDKHYIFNT